MCRENLATSPLWPATRREELAPDPALLTSYSQLWRNVDSSRLASDETDLGKQPTEGGTQQSCPYLERSTQLRAKLSRPSSPTTRRRLNCRLALADSAFRAYRLTSFDERAELVRAMADVLEADQVAIAEMMTLEMGKPVVQARNEVTKCVGVLRYYAEHAPAMLADEAVAGTAAKKGSYIKYQPIGPVLAVMPWNFPLWQVIRFAAPTFMVGNVALLKHASNVPQTALNIEEAARRAGFPEGVFQTLLVGGDRVQAILEDDRVAAATLTGSEGAGRSVAAVAGNAIKKTVLELGGADPFIVMASADLDRAVEIGVWARVQNNGQSCIAAKRFIIDEQVADEYEERYAEAMAKLVVGDPLDEATQVGPLATAQGRDEVDEQVKTPWRKGPRPSAGRDDGRPGMVRPAHGPDRAH